MSSQNPNPKDKQLHEWMNTNLFSNQSTLTRIRCLLDLCDGVDRSDGDFAEDALIRVLKNDVDPIVRHEAAFTLYKLYNRQEIEGKRALEALCHSAFHDVSIVARHESTESLGFFNHPQAIETLQALSKDPNPDVVATALISLERLGQLAG